MGQRLVITVHAFDEDIAKIYYHWSAYTTSAFQETKDIIDNVDWFDCNHGRRYGRVGILVGRGFNYRFRYGKSLQ